MLTRIACCWLAFSFAVSIAWCQSPPSDHDAAGQQTGDSGDAVIQGIEYRADISPEDEERLLLNYRGKKALEDPRLMRIVHFLLNGADPEGAMEALAVMPNQARDMKSAGSPPKATWEEYLAEYEKKQGRTLTAQERRFCLEEYNKNILAPAQRSQGELLWPEQRLQVLSWTPESRGLSKLLTETPIGEAIGLTEAQREKIRRESQRIGNRLFIEYCRALEEANELYNETLTPEQRTALSELYEERDIVADGLRHTKILHTLMYEWPRREDRTIDYSAHRRKPNAAAKR